MSSYLLLRNNKESGPFTIEEVMGMPLKTYDLLWVVGKSAAWRYPGEIPELKSVAPPLPEQNSDLFTRRPFADNSSSDSGNNKKSEFSNSRPKENNARQVTSRSVYVNLPAEKKQATIASIRPEPAFDFSDLYRKQTNRAAVFSGKILWICSIMLLFGTGILTGFFISDRRNFFSTDENHPQSKPALQSAVLNNKKDILPAISTKSQYTPTTTSTEVSSVKTTGIVSKKLIIGTDKKKSKNGTPKKDSALNQSVSFSSFTINDSLRQNEVSKTDLLYQKIKAHPENYINLVTGRYTTGIFGGISSFPVTVTNNSTVLLNTLVINIDYIQNNGKIYKTDNLSISDLEPAETVTLKAPKSPRGIKIATRIQLVNSPQPNPGYSR
jgi:hypothetical protein